MSERIAALTLNHIGDVVFVEPALTALRAGHPTARLVVITSPEGQAVLACNPAVDEVWVRQRDGWSWCQLARRLRRYMPTVAVSFSPSSLGLALCAFLSGAPRRIGFAFRPGLPLLFTAALPLDPQRHVVEDYLALVETAGGKPVRQQPRLFVTAEERSHAYQRLQQLGWDGTTPLLGCHPFSSVASKEWSTDNFATLLRRLSGALGVQPVIFGSDAERHRAERLAHQVQGIVAAGALALREFIAAVTWCSGFIGGDSGPVHIAAALGVPTVALFGPTDPIRTGPLGSQVTVVRSPTGDMRDIPLEAVWAAAKTLGTKVGAGQCPSRSSS